MVSPWSNSVAPSIGMRSAPTRLTPSNMFTSETNIAIFTQVKAPWANDSYIVFSLGSDINPLIVKTRESVLMVQDDQKFWSELLNSGLGIWGELRLNLLEQFIAAIVLKKDSQKLIFSDIKVRARYLGCQHCCYSVR